MNQYKGVSMKMHIDTNACTGHGVCESIRPDIFEVGSDNIAYLLTTEFAESDRPDLEDAVYRCPTQALRLEG
jgi:ferredoxin